MKFCTDKVVIRTVEEDDLIFLEMIMREKDIIKYLPSGYKYIKNNYNRNTNEVMCFAVEIYGFIIGGIIAVKLDSKSYSISYFLGNQYRKKGYMISAMKTLIAWFKQENICNKMSFFIERDNITSMTLVKKIGGKSVLRKKELSRMELLI